MLRLNSKVHGIIDYAVIIFLWLSPALFELPPVTTIFTYCLGLVHLLLTITTKFELGLLRRIPLKIHGLIELLVALALVGVAFGLGHLEGGAAKTFYLLFAFTVFVIWMLTDYHSYGEAE